MKQITLLIIFFFSLSINAQTIKGDLKDLANNKVVLYGFDYYKNFELAQTVIDSSGKFQLTYDKNYKGRGVLVVNKTNYPVILSDEEITFNGDNLSNTNTLTVTGIANEVFKNNSQRKAMIAYYNDLLHGYETFPLLKDKKSSRCKTKRIKKDQKKIANQNQKELNSLGENSFLSWHLHVQEVYTRSSQLRSIEDIQINVNDFRAIDLKNPYFKISGLFQPLLEGHFLLLRNYGGHIGDTSEEIKKSIDYIIENLKGKDELLKVVSDNLFAFFEKNQLFDASAHLSTKMLADEQCVLDETQIKKFESYDKIKVGSDATDVLLHNNKKLSDFNTPILLVFGASWCPHCQDALPELLKNAPKWKTEKQLKIVYISLDDDKEDYQNTYGNTSWETYCDFKKWNTQAAIDYHVIATPKYFLIDKDFKIVAHPKNITQVNTLINSRLK